MIGRAAAAASLILSYHIRRGMQSGFRQSLAFCSAPWYNRISPTVFQRGGRRMEPFGPDFRFREAPPAFADYQRFILEHYDAEEVPISTFSHSLDRMPRFNCFHSVDNRPRRSMDDFVFRPICCLARPGMKNCTNAPGTGKSPTMWCWSSCSALWTPAVPNSCCSCISPWASHGRIMRANPRAIKSISVPWRHWKKASIKISKKACFSSGNLIEYQC